LLAILALPPPILLKTKTMNPNIVKIIKISLKIINVLVIVLALGVLGYYLGYKKLENNLMQKGANILWGQILRTVNTTGQLEITKDIILVPK